MKLALSLFLLVALVVILMPDGSESSPARRGRQSRYQVQRAARRRFNMVPAFQRARTARRLSPVRRRGRARFARRRNMFRRRGRQDDLDAPPVEENAVDSEGGEEAGSDVPEWCDPTKPMGAWLNYKQIRVICGDRGYSDFGPYGGIPMEDGGEGGEDGGDGGDMDVDSNGLDGEDYEAAA